MGNELEVVNIRLIKEPSLYSEQILDTPQAVVELMAQELSQYDREVFCILNMKNNGQVINMNMVSVGTINASLVIPREVFKSSILANASAMPKPIPLELPVIKTFLFVSSINSS